MKAVRKSGFTVIELVVAIVIVVLIAVLIPRLITARRNAQRDACINNLRQIDGARWAWSLEQKKSATNTVMMSDLTPYLKNGNGMKCPAGGVYKVGPLVSNEPTCTIVGHTVQ